MLERLKNITVPKLEVINSRDELYYFIIFYGCFCCYFTGNLGVSIFPVFYVGSDVFEGIFAYKGQLFSIVLVLLTLRSLPMIIFY